MNNKIEEYKKTGTNYIQPNHKLLGKVITKLKQKKWKSVMDMTELHSRIHEYQVTLLKGGEAYGSNKSFQCEKKSNRLFDRYNYLEQNQTLSANFNQFYQIAVETSLHQLLAENKFDEILTLRIVELIMRKQL